MIFCESANNIAGGIERKETFSLKKKRLNKEDL
jgi:hypothetical protein